MLFKLLFPGVVFHELAHYLACVFFGVKVYKVRLFDSSEAFVEHAVPRAWQSLGISLAPFALNNSLGFWLLLLANDLWLAHSIVSVLFYWLAFALLFHSFPSEHDAMNSFNSTKSACLKRLKRGGVLARFCWLALAPLIFLPILFLTGLLLIFDKNNFLKLAWVLLALFLATRPLALIFFINNIFI